MSVYTPQSSSLFKFVSTLTSDFSSNYKEKNTSNLKIFYLKKLKVNTMPNNSKYSYSTYIYQVYILSTGTK